MKVSQRRSTRHAVAACLAGALAGWFYALPYFAVKSMTEAAEQNDYIRLAAYVDLPALKDDLKSSLNASFAEDTFTTMKSRPFEALGMAFSSALIGTLVDALVTPENLAKIIQGEKPTFGPSPQDHQATVKQAFAADTSMRYIGFDSFVVAIKNRNSADRPLVMLLSRHGLISWKLSAVRIPFDGSSAPKLLGSHTNSPAPGRATPSQGHSGWRDRGHREWLILADQHPADILEDKQIAGRLKEILGLRYNDLCERLMVASHGRIEGDYLLARGCRQSECGWEEAAFALNIVTGEAAVAIKMDGTVLTFGDVSARSFLPWQRQ